MFTRQLMAFLLAIIFIADQSEGKKEKLIINLTTASSFSNNVCNSASH